MYEAEIAIGVAGLPADHSAVQAAIKDFKEELRESTEVWVEERSGAGAGQKGGIWSLVALWATPAGLLTLTTAVKVWQSRERHRTLTLTITDSTGAPRTYTVSGDAASDATLSETMVAALGGTVKPRKPNDKDTAEADESGHGEHALASSQPESDDDPDGGE